MFNHFPIWGYLVWLVVVVVDLFMDLSSTILNVLMDVCDHKSLCEFLTVPKIQNIGVKGYGLLVSLIIEWPFSNKVGNKNHLQAYCPEIIPVNMLVYFFLVFSYILILNVHIPTHIVFKNKIWVILHEFCILL